MNTRYVPEAAADARRRILAFLAEHLTQDVTLHTGE